MDAGRPNAVGDVDEASEFLELREELERHVMRSGHGGRVCVCDERQEEEEEVPGEAHGDGAVEELHALSLSREEDFKGPRRSGDGGRQWDHETMYAAACATSYGIRVSCAPPY